MIYLIILITFLYCCSIGYVIIGFIKISILPKKEQINEVVKKISVLIPVRNEEDNISNCLDSLENQLFNNANFEVILINDHSSDNTLLKIQNFIKNSKLNINVYHLTETTSKKAALKLGIKKASYSVIATTDADCILPQKWLSIVSNSIGVNSDMLLGPVIFGSGKGLFYELQTLDMMAIQGVEFGTLYYKNPILNNAANLAYKKEVYNNLLGYDTYGTPSGDDIFLLEKFKKNLKENVKGVLRSDFIVETKALGSIKDFWNQRLRWASKSKYYKDGLLIYFSLIILFQNLIQLIVYFELVFIQKYKMEYLILLLCKWLIDFILLFLVSSFFNRRKSLLYFIPIQVLYPIYIVVVGIASKKMKFEWKERSFNG